jgi:Uma2 family endonuclease
LAGWRRTRLAQVPDAPYLALAPDWVCEVTSPSTAMLDRAKKLQIYARAKVGHAWVIDPSAHLLEVLQLDAGRWVISAAYAGAKEIRAEPFSDVPLDLGLLWTGGPNEAKPGPRTAGRRRRAADTRKRTVAASPSGAERRRRRP